MTRPRLAVAAALAALLGLFVIFLGIQLADSRTQARNDVEQRFEDRAKASAALTESLFSSTSASSAAQNAGRFGDAQVSEQVLAQQSKQSNNLFLMVLDKDGKVIGAAPGTPKAAEGLVESKPAWVRQALAGKPYSLSGVQGEGRKSVIGYAQPFPTRFGRRVLVSGLSGALISDFLGGALKEVPNVKGGRGYVIDDQGKVVASPDGNVVPGENVNEPGLLPALADGTAGPFGDDNFFASDPVQGSPWKVVLTAPQANLYAPVTGSREWVPWILLAAFALAAALALVLLFRMLRNAGHLAEAHEDLAVANTALERRADELSRSNEQLERFASIASHDLQEPLRKVQTFAERMELRESGNLSDNGRDYLKRMSDAASRMQDLIDDLLAFSRLATQASRTEEVHLDDVAEAVMADLSTVIEETDATVDVGELPTLEADPLRMRQLLQNLVSNGIKFRREGVSPVVKITGKVKGKVAEIEVSDNGIGFDPRYAGRIFRVFERLHGREEYPGTGIGLALCRRIAERQGGTITGDGRPGEGATFTVTLPLEPAEDLPLSAPTSTSNGAAEEKPLAPV